MGRSCPEICSETDEQVQRTWRVNSGMKTEKRSLSECVNSHLVQKIGLHVNFNSELRITYCVKFSC